MSSMFQSEQNIKLYLILNMSNIKKLAHWSMLFVFFVQNMSVINNKITFVIMNKTFQV